MGPEGLCKKDANGCRINTLSNTGDGMAGGLAGAEHCLSTRPGGRRAGVACGCSRMLHDPPEMVLEISFQNRIEFDTAFGH